MEKKIPYATGNNITDFIFTALAGELLQPSAIKMELKKSYHFDTKIFDQILRELIEHEFLQMKGSHLVLTNRGRQILKQCPHGITLEAVNILTDVHAESLVHPTIKQPAKEMLTWGKKARRYYPYLIPYSFIVTMGFMIYLMFVKPFLNK